MKSNKLILTVAFLMFCAISIIVLVYAESLDEATLRSGVVVGYACIPSPLVPGETYTIRWISQAYVPIRSKFQIIYSDGSNDIVNGILYDTKRGGYHISDRYSTKYYFQAEYTVPLDKSGDAMVGFHHAQDDGERGIWMYGLFPTGVIRRPYRVAGKNFYVTISSNSFHKTCTQNGEGGQCVKYVRDYFGGSYQTMPGLCQFNADCGAYNAWGHWDLGFGRGQLPDANSTIVIGKNAGSSEGHVAVVTRVSCNPEGTYCLKVQESNWDFDELVDCDVTYTFYPETSEVTRESGSNRYPVLGFIYGSR